jgi:carbonic anhydrase
MKKPEPETASESDRSPRAVDFTYRYNFARPRPFFVPDGWRAAANDLEEGNRKIVRFYQACRDHGYPRGTRRPVVELSAPEAEGQPRGDDGLPRQQPFAAMIGCSDARVPLELLFGQEFNDIFNIRVAGNVLAEEGIGSLLYALRSFVPDVDVPHHRGLKLAGVIGHRGCGAVTATVRAFLDPVKDAPAFGEPIGAILRRITSPALVVAVETMDAVFGAGAATDPSRIFETVELTVYVNAAWVAHETQRWVNSAGTDVADRVGVVYGVFDPSDYRVRSLPASVDEPDPAMFGRPPADQDELRALAATIAGRLRPAGSP